MRDKVDPLQEFSLRTLSEPVTIPHATELWAKYVRDSVGMTNVSGFTLRCVRGDRHLGELAWADPIGCLVRLFPLTLALVELKAAEAPTGTSNRRTLCFVRGGTCFC